MYICYICFVFTKITKFISRKGIRFNCSKNFSNSQNKNGILYKNLNYVTQVKHNNSTKTTKKKLYKKTNKY